MAKSVTGRFYHSKAWETCRQSYLVTHSLCERCLAKGRIVPAKIVHHKIYLDDRLVNDPEIALNHENLEAVCVDCHNKEHFGEKVEPRWSISSEGELQF
jgi:5-methylcytosine-specific restriction endonuclease McrA